MDAYRELIDPSRVNNCVGCNFISPTQKNLVVGKGSLLQIFDIITPRLPSANKPHYRLKLVSQFKLQGTITDLKPIKTIENPSLHYLIVSTKYAKFSIIKWDHHHNTISTVSLHYYENAIQNSTYEKLSVSELLLEPTYNSVSCLRFKNLLCFLPFETIDEEDDDDDDEEDEEEEEEQDEKDNDKDEEMKDGNEKETNGKIIEPRLFYDASFIIDATTLDSSIGSVVDMQFLHNYREPTIGVLSLKSEVWAGNLLKSKDNIQFQVLTLDLNLKSTISVFKIDNLPYEIDRVIPLPSPLNGVLLVGCNELIHVDNGGVMKRIAVNKFTELTTASIKSFQNQSDLELKLEGCAVVPIPDDHRVLLVLKTGEFYYINFELDGKSIKRVHIDVVDKKLYEKVKLTYPGEVAVLDKNLLFFANSSGNSPLVQVKYRDSLTDSKSRAVEEEESEEEDDKKDDDEDDDDLYKEEEEEEEQKNLSKTHIEFVYHDELINNGPASSFTLGVCSREQFKCNLPNPAYNEVSIISNAGTHESTKLNIITPTIQPNISSSLTFSQVNRMWNLNQKYLITSDDVNFKSEIFQIEKSYKRMKSKDFINDELTINMHELNNGKFILQVTPHQIVLYDNKFKQRFNLNDEIKEDEILSSVLRDEILMIFLASGDVMIFAINTYNESYDKVEIPKLLADTIITTGYITNSHLLSVVLKDVIPLLKKRKHSLVNGAPVKTPNVEPPKANKLKTFILVTGDNRIVAFNRFHGEKCFQLNDVGRFTDNLALGFFDPNQQTVDPFIKQIMLNELGDKVDRDEYLTILTIGGEVYMYRLYYDGENYFFRKEKDLAITGAPENAFSYGTSVERRLVYFPNLNGFTCIFLTGVIPYLILKTVHAIPRIFQFSKVPAVSISAFSDSKIKNGLIFLDNEQNARICELPLDYNYEFNLPMKHVPIGESIKDITYHESSDCVVVSTFKEIPYNCLDEEDKPIVGVMEDRPAATSFKGSIKLISPYNWSVIDSVELEDNEVGMTLKSMVLDVGSSSLIKKFKNKREYIVLGTGKYRIEDLAANGSFKIFEIIDIIPEPGRPETNHKFKETFQENIKGAVTSVCELSGRFLVSQGQKVIVRDLQDDGTVPVAFLDTPVYVSESKSFGNLLILGDPLKGCWLIGFDAEPFRMIMLGKDTQHLSVECADFIVKDDEIYIVVADNNNVLHLLSYDPDDPQSINGTKLLTKASFEVSSPVSALRSLPVDGSNFQTIGSTEDGSFFNVFPVSEATYRRMYILQQQLSDKEYHYCGLNPRLNRVGNLELKDNNTNLKPILDYDLIRVFAKLNNDRKKNFANKVSGKSALQDIWKDIIAFEHTLDVL
ncbi:Protein CFT1 [Candida viswanathii]|uniref:Protein CFT1 n=1 Tax=Candida viswanathii TaxID=5486 RepID=A0A367XZU9_9ASCO|nr:Protein CFT1 [Candida viswanathii]